MDDTATPKRCLLCGQEVPAQAVKCPACGKGRFEVAKRPSSLRPGAGPRPARAAEAVRPSASAAPSSPARPASAPPSGAARPRGWAARLWSWLRGRP